MLYWLWLCFTVGKHAAKAHHEQTLTCAPSLNHSQKCPPCCQQLFSALLAFCQAPGTRIMGLMIMNTTCLSFYSLQPERHGHHDGWYYLSSFSFRRLFKLSKELIHFSALPFHPCSLFLWIAGLACSSISCCLCCRIPLL